MSTHLILSGITVRQDANGRFCLNDLHRAAGGAQKDKPVHFLALQSTDDLIEILKVENSTSEKINTLYICPVNPVKSFTEEQGTFVVKELVYAYAMWISAKFHLKVIHAYDAMMREPLAPVLVDSINIPKDQYIRILERLAGVHSHSPGGGRRAGAAQWIDPAPDRNPDWKEKVESHPSIPRRNSFSDWYFECLLRGYQDPESGDWRMKGGAEYIRSLYWDWCQSAGVTGLAKLRARAIGGLLYRYGVERFRYPFGTRDYGYAFPALPEARRAFENACGGSLSWGTQV